MSGMPTAFNFNTLFCDKIPKMYLIENNTKDKFLENKKCVYTRACATLL